MRESLLIALCSPGDVKDFVREIERENNRIALRRQHLAKVAQRAAEARVRAAAQAKPASPANNGTAPASDHANPTPAPIHLVTPTPMRPPLATSTSTSPPLHPSLPAKPGTVPLPIPPTIPVVAKTPTPVVVAAAAATPAPPAAPPIIVHPPVSTDPIIASAEEVSALMNRSLVGGVNMVDF